MNQLPNPPAWLPDALVGGMILLFGLALVIQAFAR